MNVSRRELLAGVLGAGVGAVGSSGFGGTALRDELPDGHRSDDDLLDNRELESSLLALEDAHPDRVSVASLGESNRGRPIWGASIGRSDAAVDVMAMAEQHGDELLTADGLLELAGRLAGGRGPTDGWLESVRVHLVPRVNPDGFVERRRYNDDRDAPAGGDDAEARGVYAAKRPGVGWDVNRYHWPDWTASRTYRSSPSAYPENPVPEARAVLGFVDATDPAWIVDVHRQDSHLQPSPAGADGSTPEAGAGSVVTGSLLWPLNRAVPEAAVATSKRLAYAVYESLTASGDATYTRYPGGTYAGIARNAYGLDGRGSVLFELSAATLGDRSYRVGQVADGVLAAIEATATGSLSAIDADAVEAIPPRGAQEARY